MKGKIFFYEVGTLVTYLSVTCDDKTAIRVAQRVMHWKGLYAIVALVFYIGGVNVLTITWKSWDSIAASNVSVTMVPRTLIQSSVCLAHWETCFLKAPWLLTIPWSFAVFSVSRFFITPLTFNPPDVIGSLKHPIAIHCNNQLDTCT